MKYSYRKVKRQGRKDGRRWKWKFWPFFREPKEPNPPDDFEGYASYEEELKEATENDIAILLEKWEDIDRRLKQIYCRALGKFKIAEDELEKETKEEEDARKKYMKATQDFLAMEQPHLSSGWKKFWLIIFGLGEFPLNGLAFSIFGAGRIETYIMAVAMCIGIPWAAHFTGKTLRQEKTSKKEQMVLIGVILGVFLGLIALAILRAEYFAEMVKEFGLKLSPPLIGTLFVVINLVIFVFAGLVSYEGTTPNHNEYIKKKNAFKNTLRNFLKEKSEAKQALCNYKKASEELKNADVHREKMFKRFKQKAQGKIETYEWFVMVYRHENICARGGNKPKSLTLQIKSIELPLGFQEVDRNCEGSSEKKTA